MDNITGIQLGEKDESSFSQAPLDTDNIASKRFEVHKKYIRDGGVAPQTIGTFYLNNNILLINEQTILINQ
jgi:hypothetical protein